MNNGAKVLVSVGPFSLIVLCVVSAAFVLTIRNPAPLMYASEYSAATVHWTGSRPPLPVRAEASTPAQPQAPAQSPAPAKPGLSYADMMEEQKRRRVLIDKACREAGMPRELDLGREGDHVWQHAGHLLVDDKYKILFGFIPKVSCTTWKGVLNKLKATHKNVYQLHNLRGVGKFNHTEIIYRVQNYRKALFVREPSTRLLSAYLSKFRSSGSIRKTWDKKIGRDIVKKYRGVDVWKRNEAQGWKKSPSVTFTEFIKYITDLGPDVFMFGLNDHFLPQYVVSNLCQIEYDFIGHYENIAAEAPLALKFLGVDKFAHYPQVHSSKASNVFFDEYSSVPKPVLEKLRDYYALDYKAFGYNFDDTLSILSNKT